MIRAKSIVGEGREIERAAELVRLGARLQLLESETRLSRERLLRLYKEIHGKSPPKGMLPFSTDWFMGWQANIHSSMFLNIHEYLDSEAGIEQVDVIIKSYQLYREQIGLLGLPEVLSITRAWRLVKFVDSGMLTLKPCTQCGGHFVLHTHELYDQFICGLCHMPARAGKGGQASAASVADPREEQIH